MGFYIVIFTGTTPDRWDWQMQYLADKGVKAHSLNKNPIPLPFGNHGKIYYNILLDDRAGLGQAVETLGKVVHKIELKKFYNEAEKS